MDNYQRYELKKLNPQSEEYTIVLYLADHLSEFANELGTIPKDRKDVVVLAKQIIKERFPNIKITMVKVIIGGMAVTSIPIMGSKSSTAQAAETTNSSPQDVQANSIYYQVSPGDTLWIVSRKFDTSVENIKRANNLNSDILRLNQKLIIPRAIHTVGTGDYLTVLAKKYGSSVDAIKAANRLTTDSTRIGQTLIIPILIGPTQVSEPAPVTSVPAHTIETQESKYTVIPGDTLSAIAKRHASTVDALRSANNLTTDQLRVGHILIIPTNKPIEPAPETVSPAPETVSPAPEQATRNYTVVSGDSLSVIAKRFGTTINALHIANKLTSDLLRIGQILIIPNGDTTNKTPTDTDQVTPPPLETARTTTYTVVAGDNLWAITQRFGTTITNIKSANNLTTDVLQIGQTLTIPRATTQPAPTTDTSPDSTTIPAQETVKEERTTFTYSVRSGDSLSVIAKRFGVTVDAIRSANNLKSDNLQVGQALTILNGINAPKQAGANTITYLTHTVASGDNIWDLSVRFGIPQNELFRANNLTTNSMLSIGQKLTIPVHNIADKPVVSERHGQFLEWWTEAQYVFPIGKTAKVTDFITGKSFYIKRTIGSGHADSETVTVNDSNIAKSIWGGYSWTTRQLF